MNNLVICQSCRNIVSNHYFLCEISFVGSRSADATLEELGSTKIIPQHDMPRANSLLWTMSVALFSLTILLVGQNPGLVKGAAKMFNRVLAIYDEIHDTRKSAKKFLDRNSSAGSQSTSLGPSYIERCVDVKESQLMHLLSCGIGFGTALGVVLAYAVLRHSLGFASLAGAAMSYAVLGAAAGLLIAALLDILRGGSLDDRLDLQHDSVYMDSPVVEALPATFAAQGDWAPR